MQQFLAPICRGTAADRRHLRLGTAGNWIADTLESSEFTTPFPVELQQLLARGDSPACAPATAATPP